MTKEQTLVEPYQFADRLTSIPENFVRQILGSLGNKDVIAFTGGLPDASLFPIADMRRAFQTSMLKSAANMFQYAATEGHEGLRQWIADMYYSKFQMNVNPKHILLVNGSQQAIDLVAKIFINPCDKILIEKPSYLGALQALSVFQPEFSAFELEKDGPDMDSLRYQLERFAPKLMYVVPTFQNPTGICYSEPKRMELASILKEFDTVLLEDDPYGQLYFEEKAPAPVYKWLNENGILLGSFSKIVAPGLRLGWVVAPEAIYEKLKVVKQAADLHTNNLSQYVIYHLLKEMDMEDHLAMVRKSYQLKRDVMKEAIERYLPAHIMGDIPQGGMFYWLKLPSGMDARVLLDQVLERGVAFVPGNGFFLNGEGTNTMRLNFSGLTLEQIDKGIRIMGEEIKKLLHNGIY